MSFHLPDYSFCILVLRVCVIRSSSCFLVPVSCSYGYYSPFLVFLSLSSKSGLPVLVSPCLLFMVVCVSVLILDLTFWFRPYFRVLANYRLAFCFCTSDYLDYDPCLSVYDLFLVPLNLFICTSGSSFTFTLFTRTLQKELAKLVPARCFFLSRSLWGAPIVHLGT